VAAGRGHARPGREIHRRREGRLRLVSSASPTADTPSLGNLSEASAPFPVPSIPSAVAFDVIESQIVREGFDYWLAKRGTHAMPARADLDPLIDIPSLCPSMMLKDVQRSP